MKESKYFPWKKSGEDIVVVSENSVFFVRWYYWICKTLIKKPVTFWLRDSYHMIPLLWIFIFFLLGAKFGTKIINIIQTFVILLLSHLFW